MLRVYYFAQVAAQGYRSRATRPFVGHPAHDLHPELDDLHTRNPAADAASNHPESAFGARLPAAGPRVWLPSVTTCAAFLVPGSGRICWRHSGSALPWKMILMAGRRMRPCGLGSALLSMRLT